MLCDFGKTCSMSAHDETVERPTSYLAIRKVFVSPGRKASITLVDLTLIRHEALAGSAGVLGDPTYQCSRRCCSPTAGHRPDEARPAVALRAQLPDAGVRQDSTKAQPILCLLTKRLLMSLSLGHEEIATIFYQFVSKQCGKAGILGYVLLRTYLFTS